MTDYLFDPAPIAAIEISNSQKMFPINRIFCVGRNYAAHALEMGNEVDREAPFYFTKSPASFLTSGRTVEFPPGTGDYHHEIELAVGLNGSAFEISKAEAEDVIFGYASALDMTRRDLQAKAKEKRRPWDLGKDVEASAIITPLVPKDDFGAIAGQRIFLELNGETRQDASLAELIHSVPAIIADLSKFYHLVPGDVILTGTPAGVGPVQKGDALSGGIEGLPLVQVTYR